LFFFTVKIASQLFVRLALKIVTAYGLRLGGSMQMSMRKLNSHTILQNHPLWCCCHVMYKLLYPSIRVRTAPLVSVRVTVRGLSFRYRDRRRTKTSNNHNPDPNRHRIRCPDPIARIHEALGYRMRSRFLNHSRVRVSVSFTM